MKFLTLVLIGCSVLFGTTNVNAEIPDSVCKSSIGMPSDTKVLTKKHVFINTKYTAKVTQLDYSNRSDYSNVYKFEVMYNGKPTTTVIINSLSKQHPHGGPDGYNVLLTTCGLKSKLQPTIKIGPKTQKIVGYQPLDFFVHLQSPFEWKKLIVK